MAVRNSSSSEVEEYENPRFGMVDPIMGGPPDVRRVIRSYSERPVQFQVAYETWHKIFQCKKCQRRWNEEDVRRYTP